jgi:hypothetical protein
VVTMLETLPMRLERGLVRSHLNLFPPKPQS